MEKLKDNINGGMGEDNNVSTFNDYIYTARNAWGKLLYPKGGITVISNQKVQDRCKRNLTQFVFPKRKENIREFIYIAIEKYRWDYYCFPRKARIMTGEKPPKLSEEIELDFYWVNEFDWLMKFDWIKEWKIKDKMDDILIFEDELGKQIRTGILTL